MRTWAGWSFDLCNLDQTKKMKPHDHRGTDGRSIIKSNFLFVSNTKYLRRSNSVTIFIQTSAFVFECPIIRKKIENQNESREEKCEKERFAKQIPNTRTHLCWDCVK